MTCIDCGAELHQTIEKALAGPQRLAVVLADPDGAWVCPKTGDEHRAPTAFAVS